MTPSQLEHLKLIDSHLAKLLDIAAKRTPGKYVNLSTYVGSKDNHHGIADCCYCSDAENEDNAAFIALCAGNAEAAWEATRGQIEAILKIHKHETLYSGIVVDEIIKPILTSFPLELIQKP